MSMLNHECGVVGELWAIYFFYPSAEEPGLNLPSTSPNKELLYKKSVALIYTESPVTVPPSVRIKKIYSPQLTDDATLRVQH